MTGFGGDTYPKIVEKKWGFQVWDLDQNGKEQIVGRVIKNRVEWVKDEDFSLETESLVGSFFHVVVGGRIIWQGAVVAEPQAGQYLCHLDALEDGAEDVQRVFDLDIFMGVGDEGRRLLQGAIAEVKAPVVDPHIEFRLYDSEEKAREAYQAWARRQLDKEDVGVAERA